MSAEKLDGAGTQMMRTLEEGLITLQTIHGMVERMGIEVKAQKSVGILPQQIKRIAATLQGQLKGQFGMIADQVSGMILVAGRGGSEQIKLRSLRECVAQLRTAIEIAMTKVKEKHSEEISLSPD
jgi:hypothetical protein